MQTKKELIQHSIHPPQAPENSRIFTERDLLPFLHLSCFRKANTAQSRSKASTRVSKSTNISRKALIIRHQRTHSLLVGVAGDSPSGNEDGLARGAGNAESGVLGNSHAPNATMESSQHNFNCISPF
jgi:hypothetical protein